MNGRTVHFFECIDSTNVQAKKEAEDGAEHGTLIAADMQTAGRGRRGREWESPAGRNLYFTLILKPDFAPDKASMLTLVMAMAVQRVIGKAVTMTGAMAGTMAGAMAGTMAGTMPAGQPGAGCGIKWPNDIIINGKKVCGILTEMYMEKGRIAHVLVGVGVNVSKQEFAPELVDKATDIETECGQRISREQLLEDIMQAFEEEYELFMTTCDLSGIRERYNACLVNCDSEVRVLDPKGGWSGIARGINDAGELLVELPDGKVVEVYAGEVSVRGIYGYV